MILTQPHIVWHLVAHEIQIGEIDENDTCNKTFFSDLIIKNTENWGPVSDLNQAYVELDYRDSLRKDTPTIWQHPSIEKNPGWSFRIWPEGGLHRSPVRFRFLFRNSWTTRLIPFIMSLTVSGMLTEEKMLRLLFLSFVSWNIFIQPCLVTYFFALVWQCIFLLNLLIKIPLPWIQWIYAPFLQLNISN